MPRKDKRPGENSRRYGMYVFGCISIISTEDKFIIGEFEFKSINAPKLNSRDPVFSMTKDPEKVWPRGIVHYVMDSSLGKF